MKTNSLKALLAVALVSATSAWALPTLQIDILGGVYDPVLQNTVAQSPTFTVRALLQGSSNLSTQYYLAAAVVPKNGSVYPANFGPVVINGTSYSSGAFTFGTPPSDPNDPNIPGGGIYPTWFKEFAFTFTSGQTTAAYNVQDDTSSPGSLYYIDFTVDATLLLDQGLLAQGTLKDLYDLQFSLYDGDHNFAPYSHDASSWYQTSVPDGGTTLVMVALGLLGLGLVRRKSVR